MENYAHTENTTGEGIRAASENLAYTQSGESTRFEIREEAKAENKDILAGKGTRQSVILTNTTPSIMIGHKGVRNLPLTMKPSHIREDIMSEAQAKSMGYQTGGNTHYHGLGVDLFYEVIDKLDDVTEAYRGTRNAEDSDRREIYFLLISKSHDVDGNPINVPVYINTKGQYNQVFIDTNTVATVFGREQLRDYINRQIKRNNLVRIKKRSNTASERAGLIPDGYSSNASTDNISDSSVKSNTSTQKNQSCDVDYLSAVERGDNVIPLSERFNTEQKDIRYSRGDFDGALSSVEWNEFNRAVILSGLRSKISRQRNSRRI